MKKVLVSVASALMVMMVVFTATAANKSDPVIFYDSNKDVAIQAELFEFDSEQQRQEAVSLAKSLRCPQCQNQNLVESNSPVAKDLRLKVYQMVKDGQSDDQIVEFMTHRFGDFVLYDPALSNRTLVLWFFPILLFILGLFFAFRLVKPKRSDDRDID